MKSLFFLLLVSPLWANPIDPSISSYEVQKKMQVEVYDFSGDFPNLKNIDIDARRKKRVEFILTGNYPLLEEITYEGGFGIFQGDLTGNFPNLSRISFLCTSCCMNFDLTGNWAKSCEINIRGMKENVIIKLPKEEVGIVVHTKTSAGRKVVVNDLRKKGWGILNKTFVNELYNEADVTLILNVETTEGSIILN
ncbi:MAG: hypothetical protein WAM28_02015 [Chlamydiales bacterium]